MYTLYKQKQTGANFHHYGLKETKSKNMAYRKRSFTSSLPKLPQAGTAVNLVVLGVIGILGYKAYKIFSPNAFDKAESYAQELVGKDSVIPAAIDVEINNANKSSLASSGLTVTNHHKTIANVLHGFMDSMFVDRDRIVTNIRGMSAQTFKLVSVAYGTRKLNTYRFYHILDSDVYDMEDTGTLSYHLKKVLEPVHLKKLSTWLILI